MWLKFIKPSKCIFFVFAFETKTLVIKKEDTIKVLFIFHENSFQEQKIPLKLSFFFPKKKFHKKYSDARAWN